MSSSVDLSSRPRLECSAKEFKAFVSVVSNTVMTLNTYNPVSVETKTVNGLKVIQFSFRGNSNLVSLALPLKNDRNFIERNFSVDLLSLRRVLPYISDDGGSTDTLVIIDNVGVIMVGVGGFYFPLETTEFVEVVQTEVVDVVPDEIIDGERYDLLKSVLSYSEQLLGLTNYEQTKFLVFNKGITVFQHNGVVLSTNGFGFDSVVLYRDVVSLSKIFDFGSRVRIFIDEARREVLFVTDYFVYTLPYIKREVKADRIPAINDTLFPVKFGLYRDKLDFLMGIISSFDVVKEPISLELKDGFALLEYAFRRDQIYRYNVGGLDDADVYMKFRLGVDSFSRIVKLIKVDKLDACIDDNRTFVGLKDGLVSLLISVRE